jgi:hypothetical protein
VIDRRAFVATLPVALAVGAVGDESAAQTPGLPDGVRVPKFAFVYECDATLSDAFTLGQTLEGTRRVIPITGGKVEGPQIRGQLVAGGFDWNLSRSDGASLVDASYYMRTDDGIVIRITNKGVGGGAAPRGSGPPAAGGETFLMFTTPSFEAPIGKYDWMTRSIFVGTLGVRPNARAAVLIRVFRVV